MLGDFSDSAEYAHLMPRVVPGEIRQAIISGAHVAESVVEQNIRRSATKVALSHQLKCVMHLTYSAPSCGTDVESILVKYRDLTLTIFLGEQLSVEGANHLFELGLRSRHKKINDTWRKDLSDLRHAQEEALAHERHEARRLLDGDIPRLKAHIKEQLSRRLLGMYPLVSCAIRDGKPVILILSCCDI